MAERSDPWLNWDPATQQVAPFWVCMCRWRETSRPFSSYPAISVASWSRIRRLTDTRQRRVQNHLDHQAWRGCEKRTSVGTLGLLQHSTKQRDTRRWRRAFYAVPGWSWEAVAGSMWPGRGTSFQLREWKSNKSYLICSFSSNLMLCSLIY